MALAGNIGASIGQAGIAEAIPFWFGEDQGRYILAVPDGPAVVRAAEKAGVKAGDKFLLVENTRVVSSKHLRYLLGIRAGQPTHVTVLRNGKEVTVDAVREWMATLPYGSLFSNWSVKIINELCLDLSDEKAYAEYDRHMREYLSVLMPILEGRQANFDGETYKVHAGVAGAAGVVARGAVVGAGTVVDGVAAGVPPGIVSVIPGRITLRRVSLLAASSASIETPFRLAMP